jgi:hypothetical protein
MSFFDLHIPLFPCEVAWLEVVVQSITEANSVVALMRVGKG